MSELFSGYPKDPTRKWYIWDTFQTSRMRFHKLQEAIWLIVINEIFKFPPHLGPFCQINYLCKLSLDYQSYPIQKWFIWASFQTTRKQFRNSGNTFSKWAVLLTFFEASLDTHFKNNTFGLVSSFFLHINYQFPISCATLFTSLRNIQFRLVLSFLINYFNIWWK